MANQILAAQMIPRLGVTGLASPPPGKLPSHLDLLRLLLHQQHYNLLGGSKEAELRYPDS